MNKIDTDLFGRSEKVLEALDKCRYLSGKDSPVLLTGEHGVGKRSMAQYLHSIGNRQDGECLIVDCSESAKIVENKILGFRDEDGRFQKGVLERANGGTVIFANIDSMDEDFQKKIYKIILDLPDYEINLRLIATTTKNLSKLVGSGRFYRALFILFSDVVLNLPALRERKEDIRYMANIVAEKFSLEKGRRTIQISLEAVERLTAHYWTQNLTELQEVMMESLGQVVTDVLDIKDLSIGDRKTGQQAMDDEEAEGLKLMSLKEAEKLLIRKALIHTSENRTQAAKILGVSIRTLRNKINEYRNDGSNYFVNLR